MTRESRKNSCFEVLDGLFCDLEASSVTWTYFMEAYTVKNAVELLGAFRPDAEKIQYH
jgi:hypothetical protein